MLISLTGAMNLQVMELDSKGGETCKYWNIEVVV